MSNRRDTKTKFCSLTVLVKMRNQYHRFMCTS